MFDWLRNKFTEGYKTDSRAVIIACFYNPSNSPYRLLAFQKWYKRIKHLNHRIIECLIGDDAKSQLPKSEHITQIRTKSLLWHKEALLNKLIRDLPEKFRYVFWLDTDVLFTNQDWMVDGVKALQDATIIQPFEFCVHLNRNQMKPDFNLDAHRQDVSDPKARHPQVWRSFASAHLRGLSGDTNYDRHGHVGFAWGARRDALDAMEFHTTMPLYDRGLIGGADHIMAHAAAGQVPHECIIKSFTDDIQEVNEWSRMFAATMRGRLGFVGGDLYHIWHGDIKDRQYLKRIRDFTKVAKEIKKKDKNGLYIGSDEYMRRYYKQREATFIYEEDFEGFDDEFYQDMGYNIWDFIEEIGVPDDASQQMVASERQDSGGSEASYAPSEPSPEADTGGSATEYTSATDFQHTVSLPDTGGSVTSYEPDSGGSGASYDNFS